jgi:hypothetical protein
MEIPDLLKKGEVIEWLITQGYTAAFEGGFEDA